VPLSIDRGHSATIDAAIKPTHKSIQAYYHKRQGYGDQHVTSEMGLRSAFQELLVETAKAHKWNLIPEQPFTVGGKSVRRDGTFHDEWHLPCGFWEAKDTSDDLNAEIRAKIDAENVAGTDFRPRSRRSLPDTFSPPGSALPGRQTRSRFRVTT